MINRIIKYAIWQAEPKWIESGWVDTHVPIVIKWFIFRGLWVEDHKTRCIPIISIVPQMEKLIEFKLDLICKSTTSFIIHCNTILQIRVWFKIFKVNSIFINFSSINYFACNVWPDSWDTEIEGKSESIISPILHLAVPVIMLFNSIWFHAYWIEVFKFKISHVYSIRDELFQVCFIFICEIFKYIRKRCLIGIRIRL